MPFDPLKFTGSANGASVGTTNTASISLPIKVGDLVIAVFGEQTTLTATTCTDNLGNIYQPLNAGVDAGTSTVRAYWSIISTFGTLVSVSVAATASADDFALAVACFQGPFTGAPDKNPANASDVASPFAGPATGTLTQKDELIISYFGTSGNATWSATAPLLKALQVSSSTNITVGIGYQLVSSTGTVTPGWTGTNPTDDSFGTATFTLDTTATSFQKVEWMGDVPAFYANREFPLSLRTWIADPQAPFPPSARPTRQQNWPVTIARDFHVGLRTWVSQPQAPFPPFTAATYMPGRVRDWGTVPPTEFPAGLRTITAINPALLAGPPPVYISSLVFDWDIADPIPFQPWQPQRNVALLSQPTQLPVRQQDWRVPIAPDFSVSLRSFLARPSLPLITAPVQPPFSQDDWPLPIAAVQPIRTWTQSPTIATPVVAPTFMPGRVSEWGMWQSVPFTPADLAPNIALQSPAVAVTYVFREPYFAPQWARPQFETWRAPVNLALLTAPPPPKPFNQTNWPLTPAARQPDRTFQRSFPPELVGQDRLPFRQQSWPLTPATEFSNALRSIGFRSPALDVIAPQPFRQRDWPLPIAPRPAADLRTYIQKTPIQLIGKDRLPIRQMYWPVPRAHLEFHTLRSITQNRVIYGGEVAPTPPEPPLPPPEVIHSVRAHADAYYGVSYFDEIKGRADFSRAKGSNDEEAAN